MTTLVERPPNARRARWALLAMAVVTVGMASCSDGDSAPAVTVMTRNLYLGADLNTVLQPAEGTSLLDAIDETWDAIQASDVPARMAAIAEEIVDADVDVVGLQEAMTYDAADDDSLDLRFVDLLVAELADRGADYELVVEQEQFGGPFPTGDGIVAIRDRDAILVRVDEALDVGDVDAGQFDAALSVPNPLGGSISILRGWTSVDLTVDGVTFRVVNTHLEAFDEDVRVRQATELLAGPVQVDTPVVLIGDLNSDAPDGPAYRLTLDDGGFVDAWTEAEGGDGLTCCWADDLRGEGALTSRIDLVLHRGGFSARSADVVGDEERDRIATELSPAGELWPSDHAGVVATLELPTG